MVWRDAFGNKTVGTKQHNRVSLHIQTWFMLPWPVQALQQGLDGNHGWNHDTVKCAFMSWIFNGSQRAYSYVSLFDFQLFHHCSSPLPLSRLRMRDGNLTRTWLAILVANALLPELLQPTLALLNQQILNHGHQSEDRGATSYSSQAQQWHPGCALFKVGDYDLLIHVRVM